MSCYSFTKILNAVDPSDDTIDFLIRTHHKYLMVKNAEYKNVVAVIPVDNYDGFSREDFILYVELKKPVNIPGIITPVSRFEVDISDPATDIFAFTDYDSLSRYLKDHNLSCDLDASDISTKVVFSLALARMLLGRGYKIVDIKPRKGGKESEWLPVFEVKPGFFETIAEYNKIHKGEHR